MNDELKIICKEAVEESFYSCTCLEGLRKRTNIFRQDGPYLSCISNQALSHYKPSVLPLQ